MNKLKHQIDRSGNLIIPVENPKSFEGPKHRESVRALSRATLDLVKKDEHIEQGFIDTKTGLRNRKAFEVDFAKKLEDAEPGDYSVVFMDMDKLKKVNDTIGISAGDEYKITTGKTIAQQFSLRRNDEVYVFDGDEFVVVLDHRYDPGETDYEQILKRVQDQVAEAVYGISRLENTTGLGVSTGWATFEQNDTQATLLDRAHRMVLEQKDARYAAIGEQHIRLADPRL